MRHTYRVYGLSVTSNEPISYLQEGRAGDEAKVVVNFHRVDTAHDISAGDGWGFGHPASNGLVGVDVFHRPGRHKLRFFHPAGGFLEFVVSADAIDAFVPATIPRGDAVSFLIGPVLAIVCRMRQIPCLHASVLMVDDRAFALMGDKGVGKSTTAAMLHTLGARLVTDDVAVMHRGRDGRLFVQPGYPYMRLTPEASAMCDQRFSLDNVVLSTGAKCYIPAYSADGASEFPTGPVPLERVYLLSSRNATSCGIDTIDRPRALRELNRNAYVRYVTDDKIRKKDFELFASLARSGSVRATTRPDDLTTLEAFCKQLLQEFSK